MSESGLQRSFSNSDVEGLHAHPLFSKAGLREDLASGEVFPAIRKDEVHFYHGGARLCVYKDDHMESNNRYLEIPDNGKSRDVRIPADWFSSDRYDELKTNCREYRKNPQTELSMVSKLFPEFSIAASKLPANRARLLDIECRFSGSIKDMIDCLFLTPEGALVFVEAKLTNNKAARGREQSEPTVIGQLDRYRGRVKTDRQREEIKSIYGGVTDTLGRILEQTLPVPRTVFENVPLFFIGPTSAPSLRAKEVWQRDLLVAPLSIDSEIIVIDGRDERMIPALDDFFQVLSRKATEAASQ